jgi:hypothetical protein
LDSVEPIERPLLAQSGRSPIGPFQLGADIVAKVENRTTLKISRKLIFGLFCCCGAFQRR